MHWLSSLEHRWLLIIDNADDPNIDLHEYFPKGSKGYVLINTLNPSFQALGNVDPGYFDFKGMRPSEATALLLKTSSYPPASVQELGSLPAAIVDALGYLALAITVAGSTIRKGACRFQNYLPYFEEMSRLRFRRIKSTLIESSDDFEKKR